MYKESNVIHMKSMVMGSGSMWKTMGDSFKTHEETMGNTHGIWKQTSTPHGIYGKPSEIMWNNMGDLFKCIREYTQAILGSY